MNTIRTRIIVVVLSILLPVIASAETILEQLDAANNAFTKALVAGDIDYLVNDYTEDACIIAPKAPLTCGKDAIRTFWVSIIGTKPKECSISAKSILHSDRLFDAFGCLRP